MVMMIDRSIDAKTTNKSILDEIRRKRSALGYVGMS